MGFFKVGSTLNL